MIASGAAIRSVVESWFSGVEAGLADEVRHRHQDHEQDDERDLGPVGQVPPERQPAAVRLVGGERLGLRRGAHAFLRCERDAGHHDDEDDDGALDDEAPVRIDLPEREQRRHEREDERADHRPEQPADAARQRDAAEHGRGHAVQRVVRRLAALGSPWSVIAVSASAAIAVKIPPIA